VGAAEEHDQIRHAVTVTVLKARSDAVRFSEQLSEKPFWRVLRRRRLAKVLAQAAERERAALQLLGAPPEEEEGSIAPSAGPARK
jgi:hypothetical protein